MSQILLLGDLHLADRNPGNYKGAYLDDLFEIMYETVKLAKKYRVKAVVQAGDFFDNKTPSRTSHATVQRAINLVKSYPCPFFIISGNHDIQNDRLDSVYETQPLGVLYRAGAIDLQGWAVNFPLYGVPWQQRWHDDIVRDVFADWRDPNQPLRNSSKSLVVTHAPLFPPGEEPYFEHYLPDKWAAAMGNQGSVYYGHIHEPHGVYEVDGVSFCNNGAISRGSIAEYNLTREIYATIWDSKTNEFERVPLPHKPADEIFRIEEVAEKKEHDKRFEDFLNNIKQSTIEITSIEEVIRFVEENFSSEPELARLVSELLEEAKDAQAD